MMIWSAVAIVLGACLVHALIARCRRRWGQPIIGQPYNAVRRSESIGLTPGQYIRNQIEQDVDRARRQDQARRRDPFGAFSIHF